MTLQAGDFFEGVYQLRKELTPGTGQSASRWLADDFSGNQKQQVVIDFFPQEYDPKLHWETDAKGLLKIGQSVGNNIRYFVWDKDRASTLIPLLISEITEPEKIKFVQWIENLSLAPDEMVIPNYTPEYWRTDSHENLFFYRKQVSPFANPKQNAEIRHFWKKILAPDVSSRPGFVPVKEAVPADTHHSSVAPTVWRLGLVVIGILLAISVYFLKTAYPTDGSSDDTSNLTVFNRALENGIDHEKKGDYEQAVQSFEKAAKLPTSNEIQDRLDSLGYVYESYAFMECDKYKSLDSSNLFFIADQYFHYASILTGKKPARKCE